MLQDAVSKAIDARYHFEMAGVLADKDEAENEALAAYECAYSMGRQAFYCNEEPPLILCGEPLLVIAWAEGRQDAATEDAIGALEPEWPEMVFDDSAIALQI